MFRKRIIADVFIFLSLFFAPWWLVLILNIVGLLLFSNFYEALFFGLVIDSIYNVNFPWLFGFRFGFSVIMILLFVVSGLARRRLKFYSADA